MILIHVPQAASALTDLAYSPVWIPVTMIAIAAIYFEWHGMSWRSPAARRFVVAIAVAVMLSTVVYAATVPNYDYCKGLTPSDPWYWLLSCWLA